MSGGVIAIGLAVAAYVGICLTLRAYHRQLLYRPWKFLIDPRLCAVPEVDLVDIHPSREERLYVWHKAPSAPGAPVLVYFDGNRGNISIWNRRWRRIDAAGAGFIALSYRGYGGSTQQPTEEGLHEDARMAWAWACATYPQEQLAVHGFSLGTGFAAKLAADEARVPVILEAPYLGLARRAQEMFPFLPVGWIMKDRIETFRWIGKITSPLLIVHGAKDRIVPPRHGRRLFQLAKTQKRLEIFPSANHLTLPANGLYPLIWSFLNYNPKGTFAHSAYEAERMQEPLVFRHRQKSDDVAPTVETVRVSLITRTQHSPPYRWRR